MHFWKNRRVLVIGATGFLGSWLCSKLAREDAVLFGASKNAETKLLSLLDANQKVSLLRGNVQDPGTVSDWFNESNPNTVFFLPGTGSPIPWQSQPERLLQTNVNGGILCFLECANRNARVVAVSSSAVYENQPVLSEDSPLKPFGAYGASKVLMEDSLRCLVKEKKLVGVIARPSNVFGPLDTLERIHYIPNNILSLLENNPLQNNPSYARDFIYAEDVAEALLALAEKAPIVSGQSFNVSQGKNYFGLDVTRVIEQAIHGKIERIQPIPNSNMPNHRLIEATGWKPRNEIEEGIQKTVSWYQRHGRLFP